MTNLEYLNNEAMQSLELTDALLLFISGCLDAESEQEIVEHGFSIIHALLPYQAASFIPFNEWASICPPVMAGDIPNPQILTHEAYLEQISLRNRCKLCAQLEKTADCTLLNNDGTLKILCRRLEVNGRDFGVMSFYLPKSTVIEPAQISRTDAIIKIIGKRLGQFIEATNRSIPQLPPQTESLGAIPWGLFSKQLEKFSKKYRKTKITIGSPAGVTLVGVPISGFLEQMFEAIDKPVWDVILVQTKHAGGKPIFFEGRWYHPISIKGIMPLQLLLVAEVAKTTKINEYFESDFNLLAQLLEEISSLSQTAQDYVSSMLSLERNRISREIHDGFAQTLAFLLIQMKRMGNFHQSGNHQKFSEAYDESYMVLNDAFVDIREAIDHLRLPNEYDLQKVVLDACNLFTRKSSIQCDVELEVPLLQPSSLVLFHVRRMLQETLTNIRKHSDATLVIVRGLNRNERYNLTIEDNGKGFDAQDRNKDGYGLSGIRERAALINSVVDIQSAPGKGTTTKITI